MHGWKGVSPDAADPSWRLRQPELRIHILAREFHGGRDAGPSATAVDSISITVSDINRAVDFYTRVLTFEKVADREVAGDHGHTLEVLTFPAGKGETRRHSPGSRIFLGIDYTAAVAHDPDGHASLIANSR
jgi:hypothetical protein